MVLLEALPMGKYFATASTDRTWYDLVFTVSYKLEKSKPGSSGSFRSSIWLLGFIFLLPTEVLNTSSRPLTGLKI